MEVCRLCILDYQQSEFLNIISTHPDLEPNHERLLAADAELAERSPEEQSDRLERLYDSLHLDTLLADVARKLKPNVRVRVCRRNAGPFTLTAALINRLALFLLMKLRAVTFIRGDLRPEPLPGGGYQVDFSDGMSLRFSGCAVRTGVNPVIDHFLCPEQHAEMQRIADARSAACKPAWLADFFPESALAQLIERVAPVLRESGLNRMPDLPIESVLVLAEMSPPKPR